MTKIIFLNGPPGCGKDTVAAQLLDYYHMKMSAPLKVGAYNLFFGANDHNMSPLAILSDVETLKAKKVVPDSDITWRQFIIEISENLMKPLFGEDIFGRIVREGMNSLIAQGTTKFVFSDSGFSEEAIPLIYEVGSENCKLIRIHRDNCDFSKDSRSYIDLEQYGVKTYDIENNGTLKETMKYVRAVID